MASIAELPKDILARIVYTLYCVSQDRQSAVAFVCTCRYTYALLEVIYNLQPLTIRTPRRWWVKDGVSKMQPAFQPTVLQHLKVLNFEGCPALLNLGLFATLYSLTLRATLRDLYEFFMATPIYPSSLRCVTIVLSSVSGNSCTSFKGMQAAPTAKIALCRFRIISLRLLTKMRKLPFVPGTHPKRGLSRISNMISSIVGNFQPCIFEVQCIDVSLVTSVTQLPCSLLIVDSTSWGTYFTWSRLIPARIVLVINDHFCGGVFIKKGGRTQWILGPFEERSKVVEELKVSTSLILFEQPTTTTGHDDYKE